MSIWDLEKLRREVRALTGRQTDNQLSDASLDDYLNEYYTLVLPNDLEVEELQTFWTKNTAAGEDTVLLDEGVLFIKPPLTVGGYPVELVDDSSHFYRHYPKSGELYSPQRPDLALNLGRSLILRPPPDAVYQLSCPAYSIPAALGGTVTAPLRDQWGRLLVLGTAILIYGSAGQREEAANLAPAYETQRALVQRPYLRRLLSYRGQARF